jgi:hypothetical protein
MLFAVYHTCFDGHKVLCGVFPWKMDALQFMGLSGNARLEMVEVDGQWENWKKIKEAI